MSLYCFPNAARAPSRCVYRAFGTSRMRGGSAILYALRRLVHTPHPKYSSTFATSPASRTRTPAKLQKRLGHWPGSARSGQSMFLRRQPDVFTVHDGILVPSSDPGPGGGFSGVDARVGSSPRPRHRNTLQTSQTLHGLAMQHFPHGSGTPHADRRNSVRSSDEGRAALLTWRIRNLQDNYMRIPRSAANSR